MNLVPPSDPILRRPADTVVDVATQVLPHLDDMRELLGAKRGAGIAAPQVGIGLRFFLVKLDASERAGSFGGGAVHVVINPSIISKGGYRVSAPEGCLTWPGRETYVPRREILRAAWQDEKGRDCEMTLTGLDARRFDHEHDHILGVCIF